MEFQTFKIGDIAKVQGGYAFKSADFKDTGIPVLKITNVQDRKIELNNLSHVDPSIVEGLERFFVKSGDVLISMTGNGPQTDTALVGRTARYNGPDNTFLLNQRVGRFLVNDSLVRKRFLYFWISRPEINRELALRSTGSANQANINATTIESFEISIPDLEAQDKILKILGEIDDKIELNNQINETLETMAKTIFKEWFIDFGPVKAKAEGKKPFGMDNEAVALFPDKFEDSEFGLIPKNWKYLTCKDFGNIVTGTTPPSAKIELMGNFLPFVTPSDYSSEVFVINTSRHLSETGYHNFQNRIVKPNSVMVTSIGSDLGKVTLSACEVLTNQQINTISVKESFYSHYLYLHFANQQDYLKSIAGGSATPIINKSQFEDLNILMPEREIILEFDKIIKPIFQLILFNQYEIKTLREARDLLLPKLISGELQLNEVAID
ncbi:MAG: restriction endonuclease subunit S [Bdellovibrionaceae bacterium]|nr:restriction endonuclease subunit S [Pseudobdellovibrionaceae bacterium]